MAARKERIKKQEPLKYPVQTAVTKDVNDWIAELIDNSERTESYVVRKMILFAKERNFNETNL